MRTLVRFEYDIENVKLFDIVDAALCMARSTAT